MPTGNDVVDRAIEAHGGEERWRRTSALVTRWTFHGMMFKLRLRESQLRGLTARISTTEQRVEISPFPRAGTTGLFTPSRVELSGPGEPVRALDQPRRAFRNPRTLFWWNDFEMLYFAGYVLWNYAQLPFGLLWPGLRIEDAGSSRHRGEVWKKVVVTYPEGVATHSPRQSFYFGPDGLLRRHDYHVAIMSRFARGARLIHRTQNVDGLILPARIEIKLGLVGQSYTPWPALGFVDLDETRVE